MTTDERKRNRLLTIWFIVHALLYAGVAVIFIGFMVNDTRSFTPTQQWAVPVLIVLAILNVGALIGLWLWRKAGFYLFAITAVPITIILLLLGISILTALFPLYSLSTLWVLLQPLWQNFT